jgi:hypothetical protein
MLRSVLPLLLLAVLALAACPRREAGVPLGERCSKLDECAAGADACQELDGQRFCTRSCERGCPGGFECRRLQQIGESQLTSRAICIPRRRLAAPRNP